MNYVYNQILIKPEGLAMQYQNGWIGIDEWMALQQSRGATDIECYRMLSSARVDIQEGTTYRSFIMGLSKHPWLAEWLDLTNLNEYLSDVSSEDMPENQEPIYIGNNFLVSSKSMEKHTEVYHLGKGEEGAYAVLSAWHAMNSQIFLLKYDHLCYLGFEIYNPTQQIYVSKKHGAITSFVRIGLRNLNFSEFVDAMFVQIGTHSHYLKFIAMMKNIEHAPMETSEALDTFFSKINFELNTDNVKYAEVDIAVQGSIIGKLTIDHRL